MLWQNSERSLFQALKNEGVLVACVKNEQQSAGGGIPRTSRVDVKELQHSVETPNLVFGCDV